MKLDGSKKIILLGLILLIIAGGVVVLLKGFKVDMLYQQHVSFDILVGKEINLNEFKQICKEVFGSKKFVVRYVETFGDSVNISIESITDEEKQNLVNKVNEKYGTSITVNSIEVNNNPNIRLRDLVRPYVKPVIISVALIVVYLVIRFRKQPWYSVLGKLCLWVVLVEAVLVSIIAIFRVPLSPTIVNILACIPLIITVIYTEKLKEKLSGIVKVTK